MSMEYILAGIFTGLVSGFFGVGGGAILIPILLLLGIDMKEAIGISIIQMVFSSYFGSYLNFKKGTLKLSSTIFVGIGGLFGASFSGEVINRVSQESLTYAFLVVILFAIYKFFNANIESDKKPIDNRVLFLVIGFAIGLFATTIGIGGAMLLTPIMVGFLRYKIKEAVTAGLFFVVFSSTAGFVSLYSHDQLNIPLGTLIGISSLVGVYLGIELSHKTEPKRHKNFILILNFIILALLLYKIA